MDLYYIDFSRWLVGFGWLKFNKEISYIVLLLFY